MVESWSQARESIQRFKTALQEADEDTRYRFALWLIGLAMMAIAIIVQFGWPDVVFCAVCAGFFIWYTNIINRGK